MHARDIDQDTFETIAAELVDPIRHDGPTKVVRGRHKDYGETVLICDASRCMALVDQPDAMLDGIASACALRAGNRTNRSDGAATRANVDTGADLADPQQELLKAKLVVRTGCLIEARRLTVGAAAEKLSVGREDLAFILHGRRDVPVERLQGFVKALLDG